jgi:outer membrane protein assembly factor BamA
LRWLQNIKEYSYKTSIDYAYDSFDNDVFPTSGIISKNRFSYAHLDNYSKDSWYEFSSQQRIAFSISEKLSINFSTYITHYYRNTPGLSQLNYGGGFQKLEQHLVLPGTDTYDLILLDYAQSTGIVQYEFFKNIYFQSGFTMLWKDLTEVISMEENSYSRHKLNDNIACYEVGIGAKTPFGPVQTKLGKDLSSKKWEFFFNIGYSL